MNNLEVLKQELKNQKNAIENKGGVVNVANTNPSPSEITAGISTIPSQNLKPTTATAEDVIKGKTFYTGDGVLRSGTQPTFFEQCDKLFIYDDVSGTVGNSISLTLPQGMEILRGYMFYKNPNPMTVTFNTDLVRIGEYAFGTVENLELTNFSELTNLECIASGAFSYGDVTSIDFSNLPASLTTLEDRVFLSDIQANPTIVVPSGLEKMGVYAFAGPTRHYAKEIIFPEYMSITSVEQGIVQNVVFESDFRAPSYWVDIGTSFNYNGGFPNIVIPANILQLKTACFGAPTTSPNSDFILRTVTFESTTPPKIASSSFATQHMNNGFKVYVPDESLEAYKTASYYTKFANCILPMSQKE